MNISAYVNRREIEQQLTKKIEAILNKSGIYFRAWARVKSDKSTDDKLNKNKLNPDYKLQDLIGFRIACYFVEDIKFCETVLKNSFKEIVESASIDDLGTETFKPVRRNHVYELPEDIEHLCEKQLWSNKIDKTFEVQFRTIFSEGWHEVEHDLRYKNKSMWENYPEFSRKLNGINASLETSEWALMSLCDEIAYKNYKHKDWINMMRNKIRLRMESYSLSEKLKEIFDNSNEIAKKFLNYDKEKLVTFLSNGKIPIPLTLDNIIYSINYIEVRDQQILKITPELVKEL